MDLSINGHKVVGSGAVHYISPTNPNIGISTLSYVVTNGMCTITLWRYNSSTAGPQVITLGNIPPTKCNVLSALIDGTTGAIRGDVYIETTDPAHLKAIVYVAGDYMYTSLTYPVADSWHE